MLFGTLVMSHDIVILNLVEGSTTNLSKVNFENNLRGFEQFTRIKKYYFDSTLFSADTTLKQIKNYLNLIIIKFWKRFLDIYHIWFKLEYKIRQTASNLSTQISIYSCSIYNVKHNNFNLSIFLFWLNVNRNQNRSNNIINLISRVKVCESNYLL